MSVRSKKKIIFHSRNQGGQRKVSDWVSTTDVNVRDGGWERKTEVGKNKCDKIDIQRSKGKLLKQNECKKKSKYKFMYGRRGR